MSWEALRDLPFKGIDAAGGAAWKGVQAAAKGAWNLSVAATPYALKGTAFLGVQASKLGWASGKVAGRVARDAFDAGQFLATGSIPLYKWKGTPAFKPQINGGLFPNLFTPGVTDPLERIAINPRVGRRLLWGAAAVGVFKAAAKIGNEAPEASVFVDPEGTVRSKNDMGATGAWAMSMRRKR